MRLTFNEVSSENGSLLDAVKATAIVTDANGRTHFAYNVKETKDADIKNISAILGFLKFIRGLANGEVKAKRDAMFASECDTLIADGVELTPEAIEILEKRVRETITRDSEKLRDVTVMLRLFDESADKADLPKISLSEKSKNKLVSLIKSGANYKSHVTSEDLQDAVLWIAQTLSERLTSVSIDSFVSDELDGATPVPLEMMPVSA